MIMQLVGNRTFTLTTANGKLNRLRRLYEWRPTEIRPESPSSQYLL